MRRALADRRAVAVLTTKAAGVQNGATHAVSYIGYLGCPGVRANILNVTHVLGRGGREGKRDGERERERESPELGLLDGLTLYIMLKG